MEILEALWSQFFVLASVVMETAFLIIKHNKGSVAHEVSFRFLVVADIYDMLQEEILVSKIASIIHISIDNIQSNYYFDIFHYQLMLSIL